MHEAYARMLSEAVNIVIEAVARGRTSEIERGAAATRRRPPGGCAIRDVEGRVPE